MKNYWNRSDESANCDRTEESLEPAHRRRRMSRWVLGRGPSAWGAMPWRAVVVWAFYLAGMAGCMSLGGELIGAVNDMMDGHATRHAAALPDPAVPGSAIPILMAVVAEPVDAMRHASAVLGSGALGSAALGSVAAASASLPASAMPAPARNRKYPPAHGAQS